MKGHKMCWVKLNTCMGCHVTQLKVYLVFLWKVNVGDLNILPCQLHSPKSLEGNTNETFQKFPVQLRKPPCTNMINCSSSTLEQSDADNGCDNLQIQ